MYIGQTNNIKARWKPSAYKNCVKFYNAILYYGWENFSHIILENNLTFEEANIKEEYYIQCGKIETHSINLTANAQKQ